jgi:hypothetical protein
MSCDVVIPCDCHPRRSARGRAYLPSISSLGREVEAGIKARGGEAAYIRVALYLNLKISEMALVYCT